MTPALPALLGTLILGGPAADPAPAADDPLLVEARSEFERWWQARQLARAQPPTTPDEALLRRHDAAVAELAVATDLSGEADVAASEAESRALGAEATLRFLRESRERATSAQALAERQYREALPTLEALGGAGGASARAAVARWEAAVEQGLAEGEGELALTELELLRRVPDDAEAARAEVARIAALGHAAVSARMGLGGAQEAEQAAAEAEAQARARLDETRAEAARLRARREAAEAALAEVERDPAWANTRAGGGPPGAPPSPPPALAATYAQLLQAVEEGARPASTEEWCVVHVHKGILDAAAGHVLENPALRTAAGSHGGSCLVVALPYREDPLVDGAWRAAERWVEGSAPAMVWLAAARPGAELVDVRAYRIDGVGAGADGEALSLAPGPHRFDVAYVDGTARALSERAGPRQRLRLQVNGGGLALAPLGDDEAGDPYRASPPPREAGPDHDAPAGDVHLAWLATDAPAFTVTTHGAAVHAYDVTFTAFGGSLDYDPGWRSGIGFALAADIGASELPVWIGRWQSETRASWYTLSARWRALPKHALSPEIGLGGFGAPDIAVGPAARLAASGRFGRLAVNLAVEAPFYIGERFAWARFGWVAPRLALELGLRSPPRPPRTAPPEDL